MEHWDSATDTCPIIQTSIRWQSTSPQCGTICHVLCVTTASYSTRKAWNRLPTKLTRCSAIAERPRCKVRYSFRQK